MCQIQFNNFINNMDSRSECTLGEFADKAKLSGAVDSKEGGNVIQMDLDRLEDRAQ